MAAIKTKSFGEHDGEEDVSLGEEKETVNKGLKTLTENSYEEDECQKQNTSMHSDILDTSVESEMDHESKTSFESDIISELETDSPNVRRKQMYPRKRPELTNELNQEKLNNDGNKTDTLQPCIAENDKGRSKGSRKQVSPQKFDSSTDVKSPREVLCSSKTSTPRGKSVKGKRKTCTIRKQKSPKSKNITHAEVSSDVSRSETNPTEAEVVTTDNVPAMSLKIICTPFLEENDQNLEEEKGDGSSKTKKKQNTTKSPLKRLQKAPKKVKNIPKDKKSNSIAVKSNKKAGPSKRGRVKKQNIPDKAETVDKEAVKAINILLEKHTRAIRKKKAPKKYVMDFLNESEDDIDIDFSDDEYQPSKDDKDFIHPEGTKKKLKVSFSELENEGIEKEPEDKIKKKSSPVKVKSAIKKRKLSVSFSENEDTREESEDQSPLKKNKKQRVVKNKTNKAAVKKVPKSPNKKQKLIKDKSPRKRKPPVKPKTEEFTEESQSESALDMPLLSPSKNKGKQRRRKKRKIRVLKKKTYIDIAADCATGEEDFGMTTCTEDEGLNTKDPARKRKRRRRHGEPYSVTGNWYIAQGYLFDITNLLDEFSALDSLKFRDFATCWQKKNFSLVYRGRQNFKELLELSEELALLTKRFMFKPHNLKYRIGSLYTMYGLYYKHPFRHFFRIRLVKDEYEELLHMVEPFRTSAENTDPAYILRKLEVDGAICHVASSLELCIDFYNAEREAVDIKYESQKLSNTSNCMSALPSNELEDEELLLKHYYQIKASVTGDGKEPAKSLNFVEPSISVEIDERLKELKNEIHTILKLNTTAPSSKPAPSANPAPATKESEISPIGARRAEIIAKAVKTNTGNEYLKKKSFRDGHTVTDWKKQLPRNGMSIENATTMGNEEVSEFMKAPSKDTLNEPLKELTPKQIWKYKFIKRPISEIEDNLDDSVESLETDNSVIEESNMLATDLQRMNEVPKVPLKPKKTREPPRKIALTKALQGTNKSTVVSDLQELRRKMRDQSLTRKRHEKYKKLSYYKKFTKSPEATSSKTLPLVELPSEETSIILPIKRENQFAKSAKTMSDQYAEDIVENISLAVNFRVGNAEELFRFNVSASTWQNIQSTEWRFHALKNKLISSFLPQYMKQRIEEGNELDVNITTLDENGSQAALTHDLTPKPKKSTNIPLDKSTKQIQGANCDTDMSNIQKAFMISKQEKFVIASPQKSLHSTLRSNNCSKVSSSQDIHGKISPQKTLKLIPQKNLSIISTQVTPQSAMPRERTPKSTTRDFTMFSEELELEDMYSEEQNYFEIQPVPQSAMPRERTPKTPTRDFTMFSEELELEDIYSEEQDEFEIQPVGKSSSVLPQYCIPVHSKSSQKPLRIPFMKSSPEWNDESNDCVDLVTDEEDFEDDTEPIILSPPRSASNSGSQGSNLNRYISSIQNIDKHMQNVQFSESSISSNVSALSNVNIKVYPSSIAVQNKLPVGLGQANINLPQESISNNMYIKEEPVESVDALRSNPVPPMELFSMKSCPKEIQRTLKSSNTGTLKFVKVKINEQCVLVPAESAIDPAKSTKVIEPCTDRVLLEPCTDRIPKEPCTDRLPKEPCTDRLPKEPCTDRLSKEPCTDKVSKEPCTNKVSKEPCTYRGLEDSQQIISEGRCRSKTVEDEIITPGDSHSKDNFLDSESTSVCNEDSNSSFSSSASHVTADSNSTKTSSSSRSTANPVCSFLFSSKFKSLAKVIKDNTIGEATGKPVTLPQNKPIVPFILKKSLLPKKK